ncbi:hypothetical protein MRB53_040885 [Persea americana]|nr:hypothetical protein MRB53_040885 [Persea americana]
MRASIHNTDSFNSIRRDAASAGRVQEKRHVLRVAMRPRRMLTWSRPGLREEIDRSIHIRTWAGAEHWSGVGCRGSRRPEDCADSEA